MDIRIDETGELEELRLFDPETGCEISGDIICSLPSERTGVYLKDGEWHANQYTFNWWEDYLIMYHVFLNELEELYEKYGREEVEGAISLSGVSLNEADYSVHESEMKEYIRVIKEMLEDDDELDNIRQTFYLYPYND